MKAYYPHLERFGFPQEVRKLVSGEWPLPKRWQWWGPDEPSPWPFPLPPALIPFNFGDGNLVYGVWHHRLATDRRPTFVSLSHDGPYLIAEVARDFAQLVALVIAHAGAVINEDPATLDLLRHAGVPADIFPEDEFDELSAAHPFFAGDWPHKLVFSGQVYDGSSGRQRYQGDFPPKQCRSAAEYRRAFPLRYLRQCCGYELARTEEARAELTGRLGHLKRLPLWLTSGDQPRVFDTLIDAGDHAGAWMSLNSPSWPAGSAVEAMNRLAAAVEDEEFRLFARCWVEENSGKEYGT